MLSALAIQGSVGFLLYDLFLLYQLSLILIPYHSTDSHSAIFNVCHSKPPFICLFTYSSIYSAVLCMNF